MAVQAKASVLNQVDVIECPIAKLADGDLAAIFRHLLPYDRLLVSEVCQRWHGISRMPWLDISHLNLSSIPDPNIGAIVKLCPNLKTIFASGKTFAERQLFILSHSQFKLESLKVYGCSCAIPEPGRESFDALSEVFSGRFAGASLAELVLVGVEIRVDRHSFAGRVWGTLPASLERVQLSGVDIASSGSDDTVGFDEVKFLSDIWRLQNLTCLMLTAVRLDPRVPCLLGVVLSYPSFMFELKWLTNLRELCLGWDREYPGQPSDLAVVCGLPKLEVLILFNMPVATDNENLKKLATEHPTLRILVIGGTFGDEYATPLRRLQANGLNAPPLPLLHVFVGREASEKILFTKSSPNALQIHPITTHLSAFLELKEIAPVFDGVWLAAQIKEGARVGAKLFDEFATSFRQVAEAE